MTTPGRQVRRATVADLPQLRELWRSHNLPWQQFERQFRDFQVVQTDSGRIIGSLGLQIHGSEGWLFAETFAPDTPAETLRAELWERARIVAQNHGLVRLWTQLDAVFWQVQGFTVAAPEQLSKRPAAFGSGEQPWLMLQLRPEPAGLNLEQELALLEQAQRAEREAFQRKARIARAVALIVTLVVLGGTALLTVRLLVVARRPAAVLQPGR
jgi:N-acetylglutamate synthase-like GNAT family acetyltransferase